MRLVWILLPLLAVAAVVWLIGRPPTRYVLEDECRRFLADRRERHADLQQRIARAEADGDAELVRWKRELDALYREPKRLRIRGWELVRIQAGARRPEPEDFLDMGTFDPSTKRDPALLQGPIRIWLAPRNWLARRFSPG